MLIVKIITTYANITTQYIQSACDISSWVEGVSISVSMVTVCTLNRNTSVLHRCAMSGEKTMQLLHCVRKLEMSESSKIQCTQVDSHQVKC